MPNPEKDPQGPREGTGSGTDADAASARARNNLREAQQLAHLGSWDWDVVSNEVRWSEEQCRLFGEDPETYKASFEGFWSHVPERDRAPVEAAIQATLQGRGDYSIEHEIRWPDGTVRFVAEKGRMVFGPDGKPVRMFGTTQDITERKQYEAALGAKQRELEVQAAFLKSIVENIPVAVFIKDIRNEFRVTLWNKAAEEILQVKKEEIIGKTAHDLWPKEQADLYLEADRNATRGGSVMDIREEPSQTKDRGTILLNTVKLPLRISENAEPEYLLAISTDITREKRAKAELQAAKEAAESANRAKSEFLAMMSHEIRTPMNGVLGMTQLLKATPLTPEQAEMVETLKYSGGVLLNIIDDILDYSKIEAGKMAVELLPFSLGDTVREIADMLRSQADGKGLSLAVSLPAGSPVSAVGDPARVRQVLTNLIGNAIKFTKSGGITIEVRIRNGMARTEITDTGIGIAEESRPRLFRKFSQADASTTRHFGGTGLGLAISKSLMELMHGQLDFTSTHGRGSTFFMTLPLAPQTGASRADPAPGNPQADADPPQADPSQARFFPAVPQGLRVLMAEDNVVNQKVGLKFLTALGCIVDLARTGFEALAKVKENTYDLVLMDIQMPDMDGLEATREIRAWEASRAMAQAGGTAVPRLRIIALSAGVMQDERDVSRAAGMDDFLTKPILTEDLAKVLRAKAKD
ncbi:MAG TPA: ATP-binding protein [Fibrobacteria bacterium]|nr:ATP-binding protein [Fibrobacteria bacterium]